MVRKGNGKRLENVGKVLAFFGTSSEGCWDFEG